jgi:DNA replication protein DnaC
MSGVEATAAGSYQTLRGHLAYLKLSRAEEVLAAHLEAARAQQLSHVGFLEALLGEEVAATRERRHRARLRFAHFPVTKHLRDFDYDFQPSVDRKLVEELATLAFLDAGTHTLFMGPPGVGKTHLAIGLGHEVVAAGYRVYYTTAADLVAAMHAAFLEGTWTRSCASTPPRACSWSTSSATCRWTAAAPTRCSRWSTGATRPATRSA